MFWVALSIGLILRLTILSQTSSLGTPIIDEQHYSRLATSIQRGDGFAWGPGEPTSMRPPLYPALVASTWAVAGPGNFQAVRLVQIGMALLTMVLVCKLGSLAFDRKVGRYAAAVFWLYPSLIYFNFTVLTETLFTLLLIALVLSAVSLIQTPRWWTALACGVVIGLSALTRSIVWPLPFVLCPFLVVALRGPIRTRLVMSVLVLVGYALVVGPWATRNTRLQGTVTVVDAMGGVNLRLGNYEHTPEDRMWAAIDTMTGEKEWSHALRQQYPGQRFTEGQKDKWAQRQAMAYMRANPGTTMRRSLIKFADLWGIEREFIASVRYGVYAAPVWFAGGAAAAVVLAYVVFVTAGGVGMWLSRPEWRIHALLVLPVVLMTAVHTLVFGHSRYHVPLMPLFGLYAVALLTRWRQRSRSFALTAGAAMTVLLLVSIWLRQFLFADADRIRALFGHGG
jgi:4-amino-4-deoxy-L-arabinose transferase-like glycosyltransferase